MQDIANPPADGNPAVFVNLGVATIDGTIPVANLPVGTGGDQVAAGDDNRFPASLAEVPSRRLEVWIAADPNRTNSGNGTQENPYDGSTQPKFDALLNSLPPSVVINLLPGTFSTLGSGVGGNVLKEGWIIKGAGTDLTTVFLVQQPPGGAEVTFFGFQSGQLHRIEVRDLTLHGNVENQPSNIIVQASMSCNTGGFWNVHLTHWGNAQIDPNNDHHGEAFGLVLVVSDTGDHRAEVEIRGCTVEPAVYVGGSYLGINATPATEFLPTGIIDGNVIYCDYSSAAIALAGRLGGVRITHNHVKNANRAVHQDTVGGPATAGNTPIVSTDVLIQGNYFEGCQQMVGLGSQGNSLISRYVFDGNVCTAGGVYADEYGTGPLLFIDNGVRSIRISNNYIGYSEADINPSGPPDSFVFLAGDNGDVAVTNNIVDYRLDVLGINSASGLISCWGNRLTNGNPILGLEDLLTTLTVAGPITAQNISSTSSVVAGNLIASITRQGDGLLLAGGGPDSLSPAIQFLGSGNRNTPLGLLGLAGFGGAFSTATQTGDVILRSNGTNLLLGTNGTGQILFVTGTEGVETIQGRLFPSGGMTLGGSSDPGHGNLSVNSLVANTLSSDSASISSNGSGKLTMKAAALNQLSVGAITKNAAYTVAVTDPDIEADASGGALTLTLHAASGNAGLERVISNVGTTNNVTVAVQTPSDTFVGGATSKTVAPGSSLRLKVNLAGSKFIVL